MHLSKSRTKPSPSRWLNVERLEERLAPDIRAVSLAQTGLLGATAAGESRTPSLSEEGRWLVFRSAATDLTSLPGGQGVYLKDTLTGDLKLLTTDAARTTGVGNADSPLISGDGRFVVFASPRPYEVIPGFAVSSTITNVFRLEVATGRVEAVSMRLGFPNEGANGPVSPVGISYDGNVVLFEGSAANLVPEGGLGIQLFARDMAAGTTRMVTLDRTGQPVSNPYSQSFAGELSGDGRYVVFSSSSPTITNDSMPDGNNPNLFRRDLVTNTTELVTRNAAGTAAVKYATASNQARHVSFDGRYVAFYAPYDDVVPAATRGGVFVRDMQAGTTRVASVDVNGNPLVGSSDVFSTHVSLSKDGSRVAFMTNATGLVDRVTDANNREDVFVRDLTAGVTIVASVTSDGLTTGGTASQYPQLSADGSTVAFVSDAADLTAQPDANGTYDLFVRRLAGGPTILASANRLGTGGGNAGFAQYGTVAISGDGQTVALVSSATDLVADDLNGATDLFLLNPTTRLPELVSKRGDGFRPTANGQSAAVGQAVSADGRFIAFVSSATNLTTTPTFGRNQLYVLDRQTGQITLESLNRAGTGGTLGGLGGVAPQLSSNGRYLFFAADSTDLYASPAPNGITQLVVRDRWTGSYELVSVDRTGTKAGNNQTNYGRLSPDGRTVLFSSIAKDLVDTPGTPGGVSGNAELYIRNLDTGVTKLVDPNRFGTFATDAPPFYNGPAATPDGRYVAFVSTSNDLLPGDFSTTLDVFVRDTVAGITELVSATPVGGFPPVQFPPTYAEVGGISADGRYVAFVSNSVAIIPGTSATTTNVFVRDRVLGTTRIVSGGPTGAGGDRGSYSAKITPDGRYVLFHSHATDLVPGVTVPPDKGNLYRYDLLTGTTELVSVSPDGMQVANEEVTTSPTSSFQFSPDATMTPDGRFITFWTKATNLTPDGGNGFEQIFVRDMLNRTTTRVSQNAGGSPGNFSAYDPVLPGNGSIVAFTSSASNLVPGDGNAVPDAFVVTLDRNSSPRPDLAVTGVRVVGGAALGRPFTVAWDVTNASDLDAADTWDDGVYLSTNPVFDVSDRFLGAQPHAGGLAKGATYTATLTADLPGIGVGSYYVFVVANRNRKLNEGLATDNNVGSLAAPVPILVPALVENVPTPDAFTAANQSHYYRLLVTSPAGLRITLSGMGAGIFDLLIRRNVLPTTTEFDAVGVGANREALLPVVQPGVYYVLIRSREVPTGAGGYAVRYETSPPTFLAITGLGTTTLANTGPQLVAIRGTGLEAAVVPELVGPGGAVIVGRTLTVAEGVLTGQFDLTDVSTGDYTVRVRLGAAFAVAGTSLTVSAPADRARQSVSVFVTNQVFARASRITTATITVQNPNSFSLPLPILLIDVPEKEFRVSGEFAWGTGARQLLASAATNTNWMAANSSSSFTIEYRADQGFAEVRVRVLNDREIGIDWAALNQEVRPADVDDAAWDGVWTNFLAGVGSTTTGYRAMLLDNAARLRQFGLPVTDVARLIGFELQQANNVFPSPASVAAADIGVATPGLPLVFARQLQTAITERYREGPLGRGWVANWPVTLTTDGDGNATISAAGIARPFTKAGSSFIALPGDTGRLVFDGTKYVLNEIDRSRVEFFADGRFDFAADANGYRITAAYAGGRLQRLTHSSGGWLEFSWSAAGRINRVAASTGEQVDYEYDSAGDHLVSVATNAGRVRYTYDSSPNPARTHALASIAYADGTHTFFEADDRGRVIRASRDGGALPVTYSYDSSSGVTATGPDGAVTHVEYTDFLAVGLVRDPLGREVRATFDAASGRLLKQSGPDGSVTTYRYDASGRLAGVTDSNGRDYGLASDAAGRFTGYTDARGSVLRYRYDGAGNATTIRYPNGGTERFEYDPLGNPIVAFNRRNQATQRTFDAHGRIIRAEYADLPATDFAYDARGNLLTATDSRGTITLAYDAANRLTRVDYPGGRFLAFTYDTTGRRVQSVDQDGFTTRYRYDTLGRLEELTDGSGNRVVAYQFDAAGRLARADNGNGTFTTYDYDLAGQLKTLINHAPDGSVNSRFAYTYDDLGRKLTETTEAGTTSYSYDAAGQLLRVDLPGGRVIEYEYDAAGNRVRVTDGGVTTDYTTDAENRYLAAGTQSFTHDADGNLVRIAGATTTTFTYDSLSRMTGLSKSGTVWSFEYDQLGQRYAVTENGSRREFLFDPTGIGSIVAEYSASGTANYVQGYGLVSRVSGGTATYYDFDGLGSTVGLTDATGQYVNRYSYLPFGEVLSSTVGVSNPFTYVGRFGVLNVGNGLYQMRARDYSSVLGRFTTQDPIGIAGGGNLYAYTMNSPTNYIDDTGLARFTPIRRIEPIGPIGDKKGQRSPNWGKAKRYPTPRTAEQTSEHTINPRQHYGPDEGRNLDTWALASEGGGLLLDGIGGVRDVMTGYQMIAGGLVLVGAGGVVEVGSGTLATPVVLPAWVGGGILIGVGGTRVVDGTRNIIITIRKAQDYAARIQSLLNSADPDPWPTYTPGQVAGDLLFPIPGGLPVGRTMFVMSQDPNDIVGPGGVGAEQWLHPVVPLDYQVRFENDAQAATAAAQEVFVTATVDPDLDWDTLELGPIQFGEVTIAPPLGAQSFSTAVDSHNADGSPLIVDVEAIFDRAAWVIRWTFRSRDPATGLLPDDAFAGFLPPNDATRRGEGSVRFTARPKAGLPTGTRFTASASIVFDMNAAIETNVWSNALDAAGPSTTIAPLPTTTEDTSIPLSWTGADSGSGIVAYTVHVSRDGGAFVPWLVGTTLTSANFTGTVGHRYAIRVTAVDGVGFTEPLDSASEATTTIIPPPPDLVAASDSGSSSTDNLTNDTTPTFTGTAEAGATVTLLAGTTVLGTATAVGGTWTITATALADGVYPVFARAVDAAGNTADSNALTVTIVTQVGLPREIAIGADAGSGAVRFLNADGSLRFATEPFPGFAGGVRVATADFNGDGIADLVVGTGPGRSTRVLILDGVTGAVLFAVNPFEPSFTGGVYVATGDLTGDGRPDLVITPDEGGGPRVDIYNGLDFTRFASFFGIDDDAFRGGARAAVGDIDGDGRDDLVVAAGFGGGPRIAAFDGARLGSGGGPKLFNDFYAFEQSLRNGVHLAVGDVNGDGFAELIAGGGPGGGPRVSVFEANSLLANAPVRASDFFVGDANSRGGVRLGVKNLDGDHRADLIAGAGAGAGSRVIAYAGSELFGGEPPEWFDWEAFAGFSGGVFVG
jgi:RHS repeat-associated protein